LFFNNLLRIDCENDNKRLKMRVHKKPFTLNPPTKKSANEMISALIMRRNKPKVMMVIGMVNITKSGFTNRLSKLITNATIKAVK
jgi:hypothetical protein